MEILIVSSQILNVYNFQKQPVIQKIANQLCPKYFISKGSTVFLIGETLITILIILFNFLDEGEERYLVEKSSLEDPQLKELSDVRDLY